MSKSTCFIATALILSACNGAATPDTSNTLTTEAPTATLPVSEPTSQPAPEPSSSPTPSPSPSPSESALPTVQLTPAQDSGPDIHKTCSILAAWNSATSNIQINYDGYYYTLTGDQVDYTWTESLPNFGVVAGTVIAPYTYNVTLAIDGDESSGGCVLTFANGMVDTFVNYAQGV